MPGFFDDITVSDQERQLARAYATAATAALPPYEPVLAVAQLEPGNGVEPPPPPEPEPSRASSSGGVTGLLVGVLHVLFDYAPQWAERIVDRILYGVTGRGEPGSHASRLAHGIRRSRFPDGRLLHRDTVLVATPRRLLVCATAPTRLLSSEQDNLAAAGRLELVGQVPRQEIRRARVGWHRLNPRRLRFDFTDGSWLAFPVRLAATAKPARAVAAALTSGVAAGTDGVPPG